MAFWGVEVKPKKSHTLKYGDVQGKLVLTQATLGVGGSAKKSILQCEVGDKSPVYLCTLLPDKIESCPLNLEFDEEDDVKFSVVGPTSVHLSGFIQGGSPYSDDDQEHLYGEDIAETDSDESSEYSDDSEEEYDEDFINDGDMDMFPPSPVRNSGVVIEEIVDDEKPAIENDKSKQPGKKDKLELVVKETTGVAVLESEDEDGFPISSSREKGPNDDKPEENTEGNATKTSSEGGKKKNKKRQNETKNETCCGMSNGNAPEESLKRKKKKLDKTGDEMKTETVIGVKGHPKETDSGVDATKGSDHSVAGGDASGEKKKKNKKKKKKGKEERSAVQKGESDTAMTVENDSATDSGSKKSKAKPGNVRNFANGLVIEELQMGKPDGKRASPGKKVSVHYIGKLQKNGKIFDSNIGKAPFKFILGVGQVIKGWDVGVEGMRVGDKRKLTIPPSMAYGSKGVGAIPANSWLEFNVELVEVF